MTGPAQSFDVVVIGAGPGGSVLGHYLAGAGLTVLLIERHEFPRFHIGESLTGVAGDFIRDLGLEADMARLGFPLKSGVKVVGRDAKNEFFVPVLRPTWQVRRAEFDELLLAKAKETGAVHRLGTVHDILRRGDRVTGVAYEPADAPGTRVTVDARFVVDASGHSAVLSKHRIAGPRRLDVFGRQIAVFAHYRNAVRDPGAMGDNTFIFYSETNHWAWFIPVSPDVVSIGIVLPSDTFKAEGDDPEAVMRWGLAHVNPDLTRRVTESELTGPVRFIRNYSYRLTPFAGDGWLCIGDAHRFTDPIFSFGVAMTMVEARAAALAIREAITTGDCAEPFAKFVDLSNRGQDVAHDLIRYFWRFPAFFAFLARGKHRKDLIRLLAGDLFSPEEVPAVAVMRESLAACALSELPTGRPQEIARHVAARTGQLRCVDAAYVEALEEGVRVTLALADRCDGSLDSLYEFEERLYEEFGRQNLAVVRWNHALAATIPTDAHLVFDRRTA